MPMTAGHVDRANFELADLPWKGARIWPGRLALRWDAGMQQRTWPELYERVNRLVAVLKARGIGSDDRVGVLAPNVPEYFELFFACARIGAVLVPLNVRLSEKELLYLIDDSEMALVALDPLMVDKLKGREEVQRLLLGPSYESALFAAYPDHEEAPRDAGRDLVQMYTSGTTGAPKGCLQSASSWFQSCVAFGEALQLPDGAGIVSGAPYFHTFGLGIALTHLLVGGTVSVITGIHGDDFWPTVDVVEPHTVVPSRKLPEEFTPRAAVQLMIGQAGQYRPELGAFMRSVYPEARYAGIYGLTEGTNIVMLSCEEDEIDHPGTLGIPTPGIDVFIAGADGLAAAGETGELLLRGGQMCSGYWRNEEATDALFEGGWLHTGDLATRDEEGRIYFADRSKDMIKTGGENVYSAEVERVLRASGLVADVAVYGVPDARWTETVKATVILWDPTEQTIDALDAFCQAEIAGYKRPRWYEMVTQIPRNETNKVLKAQLRAEHDPDRCIRK